VVRHVLNSTKETLMKLRRLSVLPAAGLLALAVAGPASAHVTVTPSTTAAGAYTILTVSVPHGCDGSATTKVAISIPDDIVEVTPTRNAFYDVQKVQTKLDPPQTAEDGDSITEKVSQVVYTAKTPLPDGERDSFELSLQIPEGDAGKTLTFPAIQTCEKGETAWTEVPAAGQSEDDLEHPAPSFEVTAADAGTTADTMAMAGSDSSTSPSSSASSTADDTSSAQPEAAAAADSSSGGTTVGIIGIVVGVLGLLVAGIALARTRRTA
jgi:periplasmic copper chaperone A